MNEDLGQSLKLKIYSLAKASFGIRFEDYLKKNKNRAFWGITIENEKFEHNPLFGNPDPRFLKIANDAFKNVRNQSEAGYKVDLGSVPFFKELGVNADVFLINPERLMDDRLDLDALIFHELCHMVIDASLTNTMPFKTTKKDTTLGNKIYKSTDREIQHITRHSREFCNILASAATYSWNLLGYSDGWDLVTRAMKHGDMPNI